MNVNTLVFHIHYCNSRRYRDRSKKNGRLTRTLGHHELVFAAAGHGGSIKIAQKSYPVREGTLFYIPSGTLHTFDLNTGNADIFTVHFSYAHASFADGGWEIQNGTRLLPLHPAQQIADPYIVEEYFKKLIQVWYEKQPGYEFLAKTLFQQLLIAIFQATRRQDRNYGASVKIEKIIRYMHESTNKKITMEELSDLVQLSPAYLSRIFRETTGYPVIGYFNKIKIDKAKELFIEGNKKVKEVAQALGFADEFYFSRIFKKTEGVSPSEFCSRIVHDV